MEAVSAFNRHNVDAHAAERQGGAMDTIEAQTGVELVRLSIPDEDPGPPFYARVGLQTFDDDEWVAIPIYRSTACIPADFNLLEFFHFPGPAGPGAFACPLLMSGFLLTEGDAPPGTFPRRVILQGSGVPVWFVASAAFAAARADGTLTIGELEGLALKGTAESYYETLHPREEDHLIVIVAHGTLADGRSFDFQTTHLRDEIRSLRIAFRSRA